MKKIAAIFAIGFASWCLIQPVAAQDCGLKEFASLDLTGDVARGPTVAVSIAGKTFHLLVDTAGVYSELSPAVVTALGLDTHEIRNGTQVYGENGAVGRRYVSAPDFEIGPIHLSSLNMMVMQPSGTDVDGTLAPDFLQTFDLDFDFGAKKLNLFSPEHCEGKVVYWAKAYTDMPFKIEGVHIRITPELDAHMLTADVDTGSNASTLSEKTAGSDFGLDKDSPGMEHDPNAKPGDVIAYRYRFKVLSFNGVEVRNPELYMLPDGAERAFEKAHDDEKLLNDPIYGERLLTTDAVVGMNILSKLHLYISYKEKKLYFTAADAH